MTNPVIPTPISALPPAPLVTDNQAQFDAKAFPFTEGLSVLHTEVNLTASQTYQNALSAGESSQDAEAAAAAAQASANAAASISGATKWVSGETYADGAVVWSPANFLAYRRKSSGAGTLDPSMDIQNWASIGMNLAQVCAVTLSF